MAHTRTRSGHRIPLAFAALVLLALLSVLMYYVLILAERLALPWRPRRDGN